MNEELTSIGNPPANEKNDGDKPPNNKPGIPVKPPSPAAPSGTPVGMPWQVPACVAVFALIGFAAFVYYMLGIVAIENATVWDRSWLLFNTVEAIALAAAGAILGVQIQRGRVTAAERHAQDASDVAKKSLADASANREIAERLRANVDTYLSVLDKESAILSQGTAESAEEAAARYRRLARQILQR